MGAGCVMGEIRKLTKATNFETPAIWPVFGHCPLSLPIEAKFAVNMCDSAMGRVFFYLNANFCLLSLSFYNFMFCLDAGYPASLGGKEPRHMYACM